MKVGITYDLRDDYLEMGFSQEAVLEFDSLATIEGIDSTLQSLGFKTDRIGHVKNLCKRLAAGEKWDIVFNIAEGVRGQGREAQVPALLEAYDIPYTFSDPLTLCVTLNKATAKRIARDQGVPTPDFAVVEKADGFKRVKLPFPLFAKPIAEGTGKGVTPASRITDQEQLETVGKALLKKFRQPVLVETYLPGREFTVGIVGTGERAVCVGVMECVFLKEGEEKIYTFQNKEESESRMRYRLVDGEMGREAEKCALNAYRSLGCRDGGRVDLRLDAEGRPSFMEVNPLAGLHPSHSDLPILCSLAGISYRELINAIMASAFHRTEEGLSFNFPGGETGLAAAVA